MRKVLLAVPSGRLCWLLAALGGMIVIHSHFYHPYFGIDDSNIFQVYASNIIHGYGWTYHPGAERVEGSTSLLYTLIWAVAFLLPWPHLVMHLLNFGFCAVACWTAVAIVRCLRNEVSDAGEEQGVDVVLLAYILWIAMNPGALSWTTITLMDTSLWTAVVLLAIYLTAHFAQNRDAALYSRRMSPLVPILVATRPEALLLVPMLLLFALGVVCVNGGSLGHAVRAIRLPGVMYVLTAGSITLWRLAYFGYPLPNTYYAKLSPDISYNITNGIQYIILTNAVMPLLLPLLGVGFILFWLDFAQHLAKKKHALQLPALAVVLGSEALLIGIAIVNGGDHFGQGRFLVQVVMLAPLPMLAALPLRTRVVMRRLGVIVVYGAWLVAVLVVDWRQLVRAEALQDIKHEFEIAEIGMQAGEILNRAFRDGPAPSLGVIMAGGIARTYRGYVVDLLGINNTLVAHSKGYRYGKKNHAAFSQTAFYRLMPDFVFPCLITADMPYATRCQSWYEFYDSLTGRVRNEDRFLDVYEEVELCDRDAAAPRSTLLNGTPLGLRWLAEPRWKRPSGVRIFVKKSLIPSLRLDGLELRRP